MQRTAMGSIALLVFFLFAPEPGAAAPPKGKPGSPLHPVPPTPRGWGAVALNSGTWAGDGVGLGGGAQFSAMPELGPFVLTMGPAVSLSTQSSRRSDFPCNRRFKENIFHAGFDARFVLPVSARVRPFLRTGPGLYYFDTSYRDDDCREFDETDAGFGWMLGLGAEVDLANALTLYGGLEIHEADDDWIALTFGLAFPF